MPRRTQPQNIIDSSMELIEEKFKGIEDKFKGIFKDIEDVRSDIRTVKSTISIEYTPKYQTEAIDTRIKKFENFWDWALKVILGALLIGILALLGLGGK